MKNYYFLWGVVMYLCVLGTVWTSQVREAHRVLEQDINILSFTFDGIADRMRSSGQYHLQCTSGTAKNFPVLHPRQLQCKNKGIDDSGDVNWSCKAANLDHRVTITEFEIGCEGWTGPGDTYVRSGSCILRYKLDFVSEVVDLSFHTLPPPAPPRPPVPLAPTPAPVPPYKIIVAPLHAPHPPPPPPLRVPPAPTLDPVYKNVPSNPDSFWFLDPVYKNVPSNPDSFWFLDPVYKNVPSNPDSFWFHLPQLVFVVAVIILLTCAFLACCCMTLSGFASAALPEPHGDYPLPPPPSAPTDSEDSYEDYDTRPQQGPTYATPEYIPQPQPVTMEVPIVHHIHHHHVQEEVTLVHRTAHVQMEEPPITTSQEVREPVQAELWVQATPEKRTIKVFGKSKKSE